MAYVIFDTETTGLNPNIGDRIVEIAAVRVINREITDEYYHSLINPHRTISEGARRVNRISQDMLMNAPEASVVIPAFLDFVGSDTLVAHNAEFDMAFLKEAIDRLGLPLELSHPYICTLELAKKKIPDLNRHNLDTLIAYFGINTERRHRAMDDVLATARVFLEIHEEDPTLF